jgi:hypothetical protein
MRKRSSKQLSAATPRARNNTERTGSELQDARVEITKVKTPKKSRSARNAEMPARRLQAPSAKGNDQPTKIGSAEETQPNESRRPTYSRTPRSAPATRTATTAERAGRRRADLARTVAPRSTAMVARHAQSWPRRGLMISLQIQLGWQTDTLSINDEGQYVWLKDAFTRNGERIGVGPCCLASSPCAWHDALDRMEQFGFPVISSKRRH